jgi:DNA-binding MarR family transcriptional regulator
MQPKSNKNLTISSRSDEIYAIKTFSHLRAEMSDFLRQPCLTNRGRYNKNREAILSFHDINVVMPANSPSLPNFKAMAEFRYQIRRFLRFSETAARQTGIEPQQHQLLLAVKGLPEGVKPTIGVLAERMQLQHHSTVELIDRLAERGLLCRLRGTDDRREVLVKLTHDGEKFLQRLALYHLQELQSVGPTLVKVLQNLTQKTRMIQKTIPTTQRKKIIHERTSHG